jgi:uncharacterized protein (TIGR02391 family)
MLLVMSEPTLIEEIWAHFRREGSWPTQQWSLIWLARKGLTPDDIDSPHFLKNDESFGRGGRDDDRPQPAFRELLAVAEFRRLVEPLPRVFELLVRSILAVPPFVELEPSNAQPQLRAEQLAPLWPSHDEAYWGVRALMLGPFGLTGGYSFDGSTFNVQPQIYHLRYDGVRSVAEALERSERFDPSARLNGPFRSLPVAHQKLLNAVHSYLVTHGSWPVAVPLAVERRSLGYVPALVGQLHPYFLRASFEHYRISTVRLTFNALKELPNARGQRELLPRLVRAVAKAFIAGISRTGVSVDDLAKELKLDLPRLAPALFFAEGEPWWRGASGHGSVERWAVHTDSSILPYESVKDWTEYATIRERMTTEPAPIGLAAAVPTSLPKQANTRAPGRKRMLPSKAAFPKRRNLRQEFDRRSLHPKLVERCRKLFTDGYLSDAVLSGCKVINTEVRGRSGVDKDGQVLMCHVFSAQNPTLRFNNLTSQTDLDEQKGMMLLFQGCMAGIRNPFAHEFPLLDDETLALDYLSFLNLLLRRLDCASER